MFDAFVGPLIDLCKAWWNGRVWVRTITRRDSKCIDEICELYGRLFPSQYRVSDADLFAYLHLQSLSALSNIEHCTMACMVGRSVAGFLKALYCAESKLCFIGYLGVDPTLIETTRTGSSRLMDSLFHHISSKWMDCTGIVFEVPQKRKRAHVRLYKELIQRRGYEAFVIGSQYIQPRFADDSLAEPHEEMTLMYVPLRVGAERILHRESYVKLLQFIYFRVYLGTQRTSHERYVQYHVYLQDLFERATAEVGRVVTLH